MNGRNALLTGSLVALLALAPGAAVAQQVETSVTCDEGVIAEPVAMVYGDSTVGCRIDAGVESDLFVFEGELGDVVRINATSTDSQMDPRIEIRDDMGSVIASDGCNNFTCSFSLEFELPKTGLYLVTMFDGGGDEPGAYTMQLNSIRPPIETDRIDYDVSRTGTIDPGTDIDHYYFNATAGTSLRLNVQSTQTQMDPTVEIRDPTGALVVDGAADGAQCANFFCTFSVDVSPDMTGRYSMIIYDAGVTEPGNFEFSLWCVFGDCDSDADGTPDESAPALIYDDEQTTSIATVTGASQFDFNASTGTNLRFNLYSSSTQLDPTLEVRDPTGAVVIDGPADQAQCSNFTCSFSVDLDPAMSGTYSMLIYDAGTNESGDVDLSLWCLHGDCDSDGDGTPDPDGPLLNYPQARDDVLSGPTDGDIFRFNATAGTSLRLTGLSTSTQMDPTVEIRDPTGALVIDGAADGAQCPNFRCSFDADFSPAMSGMYSLLVYDAGTNEDGAYQVSVWCLEGDCDSDSDGLLDDDRQALAYGDLVSSVVDPDLDADYYVFQGTPGEQVRITVSSTTTQMDPTIEVRDPLGTVIIDGPADGGQCSNFSCSFSVDIQPGIEGAYLLAIYDAGLNEPGGYDLSLQCLFGAPPDFMCADLPAPLSCQDNCSTFANVDQIDTSGDGIGNVCDADLNDDLLVNFGDLALFKERFFPRPYDANADFNSDGSVNFGDLARLKELFLNGPGPSCAEPNLP